MMLYLADIVSLCGDGQTAQKFKHKVRWRGRLARPALPRSAGALKFKARSKTNKQGGGRAGGDTGRSIPIIASAFISRLYPAPSDRIRTRAAHCCWWNCGASRVWVLWRIFLDPTQGPPKKAGGTCRAGILNFWQTTNWTGLDLTGLGPPSARSQPCLLSKT